MKQQLKTESIVPKNHNREVTVALFVYDFKDF